MTDVCMLYQGNRPHASHKAFGDEVGADFRHFETGVALEEETANVGSPRARVETGLTLPGRYDVVIAEGSAPLQTALVDAVRHPSRSTLHLAADETFLTLPKRRADTFWKALQPLTETLLDGVVAVGRDVARWFEPYAEVPTRIVHPPISDEKYNLLADIEPNSPDNHFTVLHAGNAQPSKNQDVLAEAVGILDEIFARDVRLVFLGNDHENQPYADLEYVEVPGFVPLDEFARYYEEASVYAQPSSGDSFPVSTLEAMLSKTPTVVSTTCGTRELISGEWVAPPDPEPFAEMLGQVAELSETERQHLGKQQYEHVKELTAENQSRKFSEAVEALA